MVYPPLLISLNEMCGVRCCNALIRVAFHPRLCVFTFFVAQTSCERYVFILFLLHLGVTIKKMSAYEKLF